MEKKNFKELFPHIAEEIESGSSRIDISSIQDPDADEDKDSYENRRKYSGYLPTAEDFIRRCKKPQQAEEIISYLERTKEITSEEAGALRKKLQKEGLRSFGAHKKPGFYEK